MAVITLVGPFLGKNFLVPLTNVSSLAFMFACFLVSCSALKLRFSKPNLNRPYKVPFGIAGIVMAILASFIVVFLMLFPNTPAALKPVEWLIIIIWILLGWIFMLLRRKRNNSIGQIEDISKKKVSK
jgi:amino acid transporter